MNNEQFRKLIASNTTTSENAQDGAPTGAKVSGAPRSMLGARQRLQPRSMGSIEFAPKAAQARKFRSAVPKGVKLAKGFVDRTQTRQKEDEEEDETVQRIKALEEQVKLGELDQATFETIRDEITAGDISRTHLVKGLDRKLLERVRRGENVLAKKEREAEGDEEGSPPADLDDAFEEIEKYEVKAVTREEKVKQGEKSTMPPPPLAGQKRTRDQILADLKAQREAAKAAAKPQLGSGFKKIRRENEPRIELDERGREVLITTDEHGNVKRRVRKAKVEDVIERETKNKGEVLGADINIPEKAPAPEEDSDEDIFANANDFNPLADLQAEGESSEDEDNDKKEQDDKSPLPARGDASDASTGSDEGNKPKEDPATQSATAPRNYFNDDPSSLSVLGNMKNDLNIAALAKARRIHDPQATDASTNPEDLAKRKRLAAMLATQDRDLEDIDMGFGGSRGEDQDEMAMEGSKVKLSRWKGLANGEDGEDEEGDGGEKREKRKKGGKKRKGDKNSAADVMGVIEGKRKG